MLETAKQELKDLVTSRMLYSLFIGYIFATLRYNDMSAELAFVYMLLIAICTLVVVLLGVRDEVAISNKNYLIT